MDDDRECVQPGFLASRKIYLRVAIFLRGGGKAPDRRNLYPHSGYTEALRLGVSECELLRPIALARMISIGALYGNSNTDVEKGSGAVQSCYEQAFDYIPYLKREQDVAKGAVDKEREAAIERFKASELNTAKQGK